MTENKKEIINRSKTTRIISNTLILFVRIFIISIVNLYTVRLVLRGLGTEDYGVFNAVAGVVMLTTSLSSVLAISTQRFYSFYIGQHDVGKLQDVFSASLNLVIVLVLFLIILLEAIGPWFISHELIIPATRLNSAQWVFQFALLAFVFSVMQIPFMGAVFAHEEMWPYAFISTIECLLKLGVAFFIGKAAIDNLVFYGSGLAIVAFIVFMAYCFTAHKKYTEIRYKRIFEKNLYKELISFSGWTFYGSLAGVGMIQGSTILLNAFFGPIINAAFGIANQLYNAVNMVANGIILALKPAMIKAYASEDIPYLDQLFSFGNKALFYLLLAIAIPFIIEANTIINYWLGEGSTSKMIVLFCQLMMVYTILLTLNNPITTIIQARGEMKYYSLIVEPITLASLPLSWVAFKMDCSPVWIFFVMIACVCIAHAARLGFLKHYFNHFKINKYLLKFILPGIIIALLSSFLTELLHEFIFTPLIRLVTVCLVSPLITVALMTLLAMDNRERKQLSIYVRQLIKK